MCQTPTFGQQRPPRDLFAPLAAPLARLARGCVGRETAAVRVLPRPPRATRSPRVTCPIIPGERSSTSSDDPIRGLLWPAGALALHIVDI